MCSISVLLQGRCSHLSDQQQISGARREVPTKYLLNQNLLAVLENFACQLFCLDLESVCNWETYLHLSKFGKLHVCQMASPCGMFVQTGMFTCDWETRVQWHLIQSQGDL